MREGEGKGKVTKKMGLSSFVIIGLILASIFAGAVSGTGVGIDRAQEIDKNKGGYVKQEFSGFPEKEKLTESIDLVVGPKSDESPDQVDKDNEKAGTVTASSSITCNSCEDCTNKLKSGLYDTVILATDITDHAGTCISLLLGESNVVFDCNGHTIDGDDIAIDPDRGVAMMHGTNNTIKNCVISDFSKGIYLWNATNHVITNNTVISNGAGIELGFSDSNNINNNRVIENNGNGVWFASDSNENSLSSNIICFNSVDIKDDDENFGDENTCDLTDNWNDAGTTGCTYPCVECVTPKDDLYINKDTVLCPGFYNIEDAGATGVIIINASNIVLDCNGATINGTMTGSDYGIYSRDYDNVTIKNCNVMNYLAGIELEMSSDSTITHNNLSFNRYGIYLFYSDDSTVTNNNANSNKYKGIGLASSSNNLVTNNNANKNEDGIFLGSFSPNNKIAGNNASSNKQAGIYIYGDSSSNNFSNNKIDNNLYGIYLGSCICPTYTHYCPGGNFNNTIKANEILNNEIGIFSNQSNSMMDLNIVCDNIESDFNSSNWLSSSGDNNTCDKPDGWNDAGTTGCTYPCPTGKPDLIITDVWNEDSTICYQIRNIGDGVASRGHYTALFIDDDYKVSDWVDTDLAPGERWRGCFDHDWECTPPEDIIVVCADYRGDVAESEETNNCRNESWKCDTTPPEIISGPTLQEVTRNSAIISWETNEDSDSVVKYGRTARVYDREERDSTLVSVHSITLTSLEASTTYNFVVQSTDASGNTVRSKDMTFETLPLPDEEDPSASIIDPGVCEGLVTISAEASDNTGVEKVEFLLDDELVFTDFSPPYDLPLNTYSIGNGKHILKAVVEDQSGMVSIYERIIDIANIIDVAAPSVIITSPSQWDTVSDVILVNASVSDVEGLSHGYFWVGPDPKGHYASWWASYPPPKEATLEIDWNTKGAKNGPLRIAWEIHDTHGNVGWGYQDVIVDNPLPPPPPELIITNRDIKRNNNYFTVTLTVKNVGGQTATSITIWDYLQLFQPIDDSDSIADYQSEFNTKLMRWKVEINSKVDIPKGGERTYTYDAVPVLTPESAGPYISCPKPMIGAYATCGVGWWKWEGDTHLQYQQPGGIGYFHEYVNLGKKIPDSSYFGATTEADYLIVTNPSQLFSHNSGHSNEVNALLSDMAKLAKLKKGVLGYLDFTDKNKFRNLIKPGMPWTKANWAYRLHPDFSTACKGYLLIVGETEIIPAWDNISSGTPWSWILTDNLYADTIGNDNKPDISVGRIIGNSASDLIIPLNTSINLHKGTPGYNFDRSDALSVSGDGGGVITWEWRANVAANLLDDEFETDRIHCANYFKKASHTSIFRKNDGFLTGDVLGDGKAEIIIADDNTNKVYVYDGNMSKLSEFPVPSWRGTELDAIATGDLLGDAKEEIIIADSFTGEIYVFNATGSKKGPGTVFVNFDSGDRLAIGDVVGDSKNEIIIVNFFLFKFFSTIKFYDLSGIEVAPPLSKSIDKYDGFGVGNLLPGGKDEIVITDRTNNKIVVYDPKGKNLKEIKYEFDIYDSLIVKNFYGDSKKEIIVAEHDTGIVIFFYIDVDGKPYRRWFDFKAGFGKNDGLAGGDVVGNAVKEVLVADDSSGLIEITDERCAGRMKPFLLNKIKNKDVIFFSDHGHVDTWGGILSTGDCPLDFGTTNPFLFASACFTGNYKLGDDYNLAEALLKSGASLYLGASQTAGDGDYTAIRKFFKIWVGSPKSVGRALVEAERQLVDAGAVSWVMKYNLYGDPKLGVSSKKAASLKAGNPLKASALVEVVVPDFEVTTIDGVDYVEIPGGTLIYDVGKPMVPLYSVQFDYPRGTEIQDVTLTERTNLVTTTGLNIANTVFIEEGKSLAPEAMASEWYPEEVYRWDTIQNPDGSITLIIVIYPFYYNPLTTDVRFYKNYSFDINYSISSVAITKLEIDKHHYDLDRVTGEIEFNNGITAEIPPEGKDIVVSAYIKRYGSDEIAGGLPLHTLKEFTGLASFSPQWDSSGFDPGYYYMEVTLKDTGGNVLDRKTEMFRLGISSGEITHFTATPEYFDIGTDVNINMTFNNTGTVNITGTAVIKVFNSTGYVVEEFSHDVTDLIPSESISFSDVWGTSEAEEGSYNIVGYVLYDSKATEPVTVTISSRVIPTNRIYPDPQHSLASFCSTADVEIWISATDTFQSGQIKLVYDSDCANVTNWARNTATFPMGFWTHTDGQEWIGFTATTALTGEYLIGTLTIHCVNDSPAGCTTPLDFVDPSALFDLSGNEITANWVDGTFEC